MTTSPQPWTTRPVSQGESQGAEILNASGTVIGFFRDYRDAELVLSNFDNEEKIAKLEAFVTDLEGEIDDLQDSLAEVGR